MTIYYILVIIFLLCVILFLVFRSGNSGLGESIHQLSGHIQSLQENMTHQNSQMSRTTNENLTKLNARLEVIDRAQGNIQSLAKDVVGLQDILQNKQTRGAFGEKQMEMIIQDGLPKDQYEFQATLSNNSRPDCLIKMPNNNPSLVVDAKFPLDAWHRLRDPDNLNVADSKKSFDRDVKKHITDISQKYLISGETQDTALLFIPSESIYAEIYENFDTIIQYAHKHRVMIVSPTHLSLAIRVFQSMLKDTKMREQAHLIQKQVGEFMKDLNRLDERMLKLKTHNDQTTKDIDSIMTSTRKLNRHGEKIEELEFDETASSSSSSSSQSSLLDSQN